MQSPRSSRSFSAVIVMAMFATPSFGQVPPPQAVQIQLHNRMVDVKTEGKDDVYVDMPGFYDLGSPSISPDGKSVAFDARTIAPVPNRESWIVGVDGSGLRKLADGGSPRWSPDGKRIVLCRDVSQGGPSGAAQRNLIEIELAKGTERMLCNGRYGDWSPDGSRLVFSRGGAQTTNSGAHPSSKIFISKADGSESQEYGEGDWPSWSPDGKKIAFVILGQRKPTLYVLDLETKKRKEIGYGFYRAQWAGDGRSFVANGIGKSASADVLYRLPARFWLDKPNKPEFFFTNRDTPFSPCVSRDGKTIAVIVDSRTKSEEPADEKKDTSKE